MKSFQTFALFLFTLGLMACQSGPELLFDLQAGNLNYGPGPIVLNLPMEWPDSLQVSVQNTESGAILPVQRLSKREWMFGLDEDLAAGTRRRYRLMRSDLIPANQVEIKSNEESVMVEVAGKPVMTYHTATVMPPAGEKDYFKRSGFIHPLYSPSGQVVTEGFPVGHMHQHGMFFAWVNTTFQGRKVDFWNPHQESGMVEHKTLLETESGAVAGSFSTQLTHVDLSAPEGPMAVLEEDWDVKVYGFEDVFLFDIASTHRALTDSPLHLNEYRYGGMGMRMNSKWYDGPGGTLELNNRQGRGEGGFFTSEGKDRYDGNHTRPLWVAAQGKLDTTDVCVVGMGHPGNFRFPQPVRIHPSMPYYCFAPMVEGAFDIEAGKPYESHYRFLVFEGEVDSARIQSVWHTYSQPPSVVWEQ